MSPTAAPENEFADVPDHALALGLAGELPVVNRKWVNVSNGGHVSGVVWGRGAPEIVLLPRDGCSARSLDGLAVLLRRPVVVIDPPGSGRSSGPSTSPRRAAPLVAEAVASFAPTARLMAGIGEGGLAALATSRRRPEIAGVVLIDPIPSNNDGLWEQLEAAAASIAVVCTEDGPLSADDLARLQKRQPGTVVIRLPAAGGDVEATEAAALARALDETRARLETLPPSLT